MSAFDWYELLTTDLERVRAAGGVVVNGPVTGPTGDRVAQLDDPQRRRVRAAPATGLGAVIARPGCLARSAPLVVALAIGCGGPGGPGEVPDSAVPDAAAPRCIDSLAPIQRGGAGFDAVQAVHVTPGGLLVLAGYEDGAAPARFTPDGPSRAFVAAYDAEGSMRWEQYLDTSGTDSIDALAGHAGEIVFAGHTTGPLPGFTQGGQLDLFVGRADPDTGELTVLDQLGDERPQRPRRVLLADDRMVVTGMEDVYIPSNFVEAWQDPMVARWTRAGDELVRGAYQTWDSAAEDWIDGAALLADGDLIASGTVGSGSERGAYVTRIADDGQRRWTRRLSPAGIDSAIAVLAGAPGRVRVVGSTSVPLSGTGAGGHDVYLAELDLTTGDLVTAAQLGSTETDWVVDAVLMPDGRIAIAGETLGKVDPDAPAPTGFDLFVLVVDPDGTARAVWQGGTDADDHATALAVDECGTIFLAGWTRGSLAGTARGEQDGFLIPVTPRALP
jgi:outer membrane protein assembly factor BamB